MAVALLLVIRALSGGFEDGKPPTASATYAAASAPTARTAAGGSGAHATAPAWSLRAAVRRADAHTAAACCDVAAAALSVLRLLLLQRRARGGRWPWEAANGNVHSSGAQDAGHVTATNPSAQAGPAWLATCLAGLPPLLRELQGELQDLVGEVAPAGGAGSVAPGAQLAAAPAGTGGGWQAGPSARVEPLPEQLALLTGLGRLDEVLGAVLEML